MAVRVNTRTIVQRTGDPKMHLSIFVILPWRGTASMARLANIHTIFQKTSRQAEGYRKFAAMRFKVPVVMAKNAGTHMMSPMQGPWVASSVPSATLGMRRRSPRRMDLWTAD